MKKRNISIQIIRIVAMVMIIADHLCLFIEFPMKSMVVQVCNSGVLFFLFISGYLYGHKIIHDWKKFFFNRIIIICLPMWIIVVVDFISEAVVWKYFEWRNIIIYLTDTQGIFGGNKAIGSLWFLTLIMICYLLIPLLQKIRSTKPNRIIIIIGTILFFIIQIILAYTTEIGLSAGHTLSWCCIAIGLFVLGYYAGDIILLKNASTRALLLRTVIAVITLLIVVLSKKLFDGQIIYHKIVFVYGSAILVLWVCNILYKIGEHVKGKTAETIIDYFDKRSFYVYVVHGFVLDFIIVPNFSSKGIAIYLISFLILTYILSIILYHLCKRINNKVLLKA